LADTETMLHMVQLMEDSGVPIAVFDQHDRLRYSNRAFRFAWALEENEFPYWTDLMRRNFHARQGTVVDTTDFETWLHSTRSRRGKSAFRAFETDLHDGRWLWMTETTGTNGWMLCIACDITSIRPDERTLRQDRDIAIKLSQTDDLTGLGSRRFVMSRLHDLLQHGAGKKNESIGCLAILDIDNFKYINDSFGHDVGDVVLQDFAVTIQRHVRKTDILGRVGGEEFMLILPNTTIEEAQSVVHHMLAATRRSQPLAEYPAFRYTFSAGIVRVTGCDAPKDIYRKADLALYAAKMNGRDRVCTELDRAVSPFN